jgi:hypothetical protein
MKKKNQSTLIKFSTFHGIINSEWMEKGWMTKSKQETKQFALATS